MWKTALAKNNIVLMTDYTSNPSSSSLQYSLRLSHDSDNFTLYYPSHVSHFFTSQILGDFGSHVTCLNQGPFSLQGVRERPWEQDCVCVCYPNSSSVWL